MAIQFAAADPTTLELANNCMAILGRGMGGKIINCSWMQGTEPTTSELGLLKGVERR